MHYQYISGFSDEISQDINVQFEALNRMGISYFEPRGINGKNISKMSEEEIYELKKLMDKSGIKVSSIGSPVGKIRVTESFDEHFDMFKNIVKFAKILGTRYIRMFSFYPGEDEVWTEAYKQEAFRRLACMIEYAKQEDVVLLHENEKGIYGDTGERCLELMENFYGDHFKAVFDPANSVQVKEDTWNAYEMMKPYIAYMHIKDANLSDGYVVPAGKGDGKVSNILKDLFASGFDGYLSIEPHLGFFEGLQDLELGGNTVIRGDSVEATFALAYQCLLNILEEI